MKVLLTFLHLSSPNLIENDHNFVFFDYKVWPQQHFESRLFWKNAEKLRICALFIFSAFNVRSFLIGKWFESIKDWSVSSTSTYVAIDYIFNIINSGFLASILCKQTEIKLFVKINFKKKLFIRTYLTAWPFQDCKNHIEYH